MLLWPPSRCLAGCLGSTGCCVLWSAGCLSLLPSPRRQCGAACGWPRPTSASSRPSTTGWCKVMAESFSAPQRTAGREENTPQGKLLDHLVGCVCTCVCVYMCSPSIPSPTGSPLLSATHAYLEQLLSEAYREMLFPRPSASQDPSFVASVKSFR